jgi:hypothetical protein
METNYGRVSRFRSHPADVILSKPHFSRTEFHIVASELSV